MKTKHIMTFWLLLAVLMASAATGEVSIQPNGSALFIHGSEGKVWAPVRHGVPAERLLNPHGDVKGDIFGDWAVNPVTGFPEVVWSRNEGGRYDVVFSWWDGEAWRGPARVSISRANHTRPLLYHDANGSRYVLWTAWTAEGPAAYVCASLGGEAAFRYPRRMHWEGYTGLLPAGKVTEYTLLTVHEEVRGEERYLQIQEYLLLQPYYDSNPLDNPYSVGQVTLTNEGPQPAGGGPDPGDPIGEDRPGDPPDGDPPGSTVPSDPRIYRENELIWVDWVQDESHLGYSIHQDDLFSDPAYVPFHGPADTDKIRHWIRSLVLRTTRR